MKGDEIINIDKIREYNRKLSKMDYAIFLRGKRIEADDEGFEKYKTPCKNSKISFKGGICWDYCVAEAIWFSKHFPDIPVEFYYHEAIMDENTAPSHTFLIFPFGECWYWFEASWKPHAGLWKFKTRKDALLTVVSKLRVTAKEQYHKTIKQYYLSKYDPLDEKYSNKTVMQFMSLQRKNPQEMIPRQLKPVVSRKESNMELEGTLSKYDPKKMKPIFIKGKSGPINSLLRFPESNEWYRGRSEILIFDNDKVYLGIKQDGSYNIPGGGWEPNEPLSIAAVREAMEEARILVSDAVFVTAYIRDDGKVKNWVKKEVPEKYWWSKYITNVYIGNYTGIFRGTIKKVDQDNLVRYGKFYPIREILPILQPAHRLAVEVYLSNSSYHESTNTGKYLPPERKPIRDGFRYTVHDTSGNAVSIADSYDFGIQDFDWVLIANVDTNKEDRRRGLASSIINQIYNDAKKSNKGVYVFVDEINTEAIQLYKRLGFQSIRRYCMKSKNYLIMAKGDSNIEQLKNKNFS